MSIQIRYFTKSKKGNTKKLADCLAKTLCLPAVEVSEDLSEPAEILFLVNAMYAFTIDKEVKTFLERNKDKIGEIVNVNSAASGSSTYKSVKKAADKLGIKMSEKEFHCPGSFLAMNKGRPAEEDLNHLAEFAVQVVKPAE